MSDRASDEALWRSVADTLDNVVLPALAPGFERDSARQLVGLARYATSREDDDSAERVHAIAAALDLDETVDAAAVMAAAAERAEEIHDLLVRQLDADIAEAAPLMETFSGHAPAEKTPDAADVPEAAALTAWLARALGEAIEDIEITVMVGGHSRRMLSVRAVTASGVQDLVVRIEQGGMFGTEGDSEARVMRALSEAGFAVAPVRWIEPAEDVLGQPFFVMDRVTGTAAVETATLDLYLLALHELHRLDPALVASALGPVPPTPRDAIAATIDHWLGIYRTSVRLPVPLLEDAATWLRANLRPTGPTCVVHGDPGPGNFLYADGRITALTDWELTHYGDPAEDWTYFGAIRARKIYDADTWRARFTELVGFTVDDTDWLAWEAFNQFKGACVNLTALRLFRAGVSTTPNLLAIGTAVHLRFLKRLTDLVEQLRGAAAG